MRVPLILSLSKTRGEKKQNKIIESGDFLSHTMDKNIWKMKLMIKIEITKT